MRSHISIKQDREGSFLVGRRYTDGALGFSMRYISAMWSIPAALADYRQNFDPERGTEWSY